MRSLVKFAFGVLARFLAQLAEQLAQWLFNDVSEGADETDSYLEELWAFATWFLRSLAAQLGGRRHNYGRYDDDYQSGLYGAQ